MQQNPRKRAFAVLDDLFFTAKIHEAAKRAGLDVEFLKEHKDVLAKAGEDGPTLIILDLNYSAAKPLELIEKLKRGTSTRQISRLGYVSHVQGELKQKAQETGCDTVLVRSAFSQNLPLILKRHSGN